METVRIHRLDNLPRSLFMRLRDAQAEAAKAWNLCRDLHLEARKGRDKWPNRDALQKAVKGRGFELHSQSAQMVCHAFLANVDTTRQLKPANPKIRYPYKTKKFYPVSWPAQAVCVEPGRVVLPMGRGRRSIVLPLALPANTGGCKLVWNNGFELHVSVPVTLDEKHPGASRAAADLGQIHQAAIAADNGEALVVSGRGIRSVKRQRSKALGEIARKRSRCKKGSRRWRKLQRARSKVSARTERQVRDLRHKGARKVIDFCKEQGVGTLYVGNPDGVRSRSFGRHHNQRMSQWEYGRDIGYLAHKSEKARIVCFTGTERGTSSRCPECGQGQKPNGRSFACRRCGFVGHRDVVGATNMHLVAFDQKIAFPQRVTYLRPGPAKGSGGGIKNRARSKEPERSSRPGTGHEQASCCLGEPAGQPPALESRVSQETRPNCRNRLEAHPL